jgi:peptide/nickel transport system ATP-binding protein
MSSRPPSVNLAATEDLAARTRSLLAVRELAVEFPRDGGGWVRAVEGVDLDVRAGEILCLVGESGCGKSVTVRALFDLLPPPGRRGGGRVVFDGIDLAMLDRAAVRALRGRSVGYVFQDPMTYLNPLLTAGAQVTEALAGHARYKADAKIGGKVVDLFRELGIGDPMRVARSYPHQLSGGMRQRVMIAMAIARRPRLLILDEPTTALDVTVQAQIIELIRSIRRHSGAGMIFVTHDFGLVAELADRVGVMYAGQMVEHGSVDRIFADPQHPYTRGLIDCVIPLGGDAPLQTIGGEVPDLAAPPSGCRFHPRCPRASERCRVEAPPAEPRAEGFVRCWHPGEVGASPAIGVRSARSAIALSSTSPRARDDASGPALSVTDVRKSFAARGGAFGGRQRVRAVNDVTLALRRGEIFALVGESGSGKSTLGRLAVGLEGCDDGTIRIGGDDPRRRLATHGVPPLAQMVFQDPYSSLNPRKRIRHALVQPLLRHRICGPDETHARASRLLELMGLTPAVDFLERFPHELSGGQRQRVVLARALAAEPRLLIADEPVSSLDMSTRAQILGLLAALRSELGLTVLLITHDLAVVSKIADRMGVMYLGRLFEVGAVNDVLRAPRQPYTQMLMSSVPLPDPVRARARVPIVMAGEPPSPVSLPSGCYLHPRCPHAMAVCATVVPQWRDIAFDHRVACHLIAESNESA